MNKINKYIQVSVVMISVIILVYLFLLGNAMVIPAVQNRIYQAGLSDTAIPDTSAITPGEKKTLDNRLALLKRQISRFTPGNAFLIINTTENTFALYKNNQVIRKGLCSTGSFIRLEVDSTKSYTFETPKGVLSVQNKIVKPVWRKPDWAFIEEGLPVPPPNHPSRYERGVLGDYALSLGDGYLIHGTLYQRFIGMPVTHGCVRLGDDDLTAVYQTLQVGSRVFIY